MGKIKQNFWYVSYNEEDDEILISETSFIRRDFIKQQIQLNTKKTDKTYIY